MFQTPGPLVALSQNAVTPTGGSLPHNNMMPFLTLNFCDMGSFLKTLPIFVRCCFIFRSNDFPPQVNVTCRLEIGDEMQNSMTSGYAG